MMPTINQKEVFTRPPPGVRKIVIATNIAETRSGMKIITSFIRCLHGANIFRRWSRLWSGLWKFFPYKYSIWITIWINGHGENIQHISTLIMHWSPVNLWCSFISLWKQLSNMFALRCCQIFTCDSSKKYLKGFWVGLFNRFFKSVYWDVERWVLQIVYLCYHFPFWIFTCCPFFSIWKVLLASARWFLTSWETYILKLHVYISIWWFSFLVA